MALREFVDKQGVAWKVWDITPESMHPVTVREFFLGEYQEGWLAFESPDERRRLADWPPNWAELSDEELGRLCDRAKPAPKRSAQETHSGAFRRLAETGTLGKEEESHREEDAKTAPLLRTFMGPSGRHWMVTPTEIGSGAETTVVLRFTSNDGVILDLDKWPDDWDRYAAQQLVELARGARRVHVEPYDGQVLRPSEDTSI
jgi:hypothetical protein